MSLRLAAFFLALLLLAPAQAANVKPLYAVKGVPVWLAEDHSVPVLALAVSLPAGSAYDPPGKSGMAAFAAALLDEGAGQLPAGAFQTALAARGIRLEAETGRDYTTVSILTPSSGAKEAFRLLALALSKPRFDGEAANRVRAQLLQDMELGKDDPARIAGIGFHSLYFGPYTYGRPVMGEPHELQAITLPELHSFARTHWLCGGLKIALAGDISAASATALLRSAFGNLPGAAPPPLPKPPRLGAPGLHILPMKVTQPAVVFGLAGPLRDNRDFLAAALVNHILGVGPGARLMRDVLERRGLTYEVSTHLMPYSRVGLILGEVTTQRETVRRTMVALRDAMNRFADEGPSEQELADAKQYLIGSFPLGFTSDADTAARLAEFQQQGLPSDFPSRYAGMVDSVSMADVRRVARYWFDPARMTVVVAGSLSTSNTEPADSP